MTEFADTNVVAYALDAADPVKQRLASARLRATPHPRTSPQVLRELYVVARTKLGMTREQSAAAVRALVPTVAVVEDAALVLLAITSARKWQLSFWDALIVEAARRAGTKTLLSEDLQHGMDFGGVVVENPFAENPTGAPE